MVGPRDSWSHHDMFFSGGRLRKLKRARGMIIYCMRVQISEGMCRVFVDIYLSHPLHCFSFSLTTKKFKSKTPRLICSISAFQTSGPMLLPWMPFCCCLVWPHLIPTASSSSAKQTWQTWRRRLPRRPPGCQWRSKACSASGAVRSQWPLEPRCEHFRQHFCWTQGMEAEDWKLRDFHSFSESDLGI